MEAALSKRRSGPTLYLFFGFLPRSKAEQSEQTPFFKASSPSCSFLISALSLVSFHPFIGEQAEEWRWQVMYGRWHYSSMPSPVPVPQVPAAWARAVWMGGWGVKPAMGALGCGGARPSGTRKDTRKFSMSGWGSPLP